MGPEIFLLVIAFLIALPVIRAHGWRPSAALFSRSSVAHLAIAAVLVGEAMTGSPFVILALTLLLLAFLIWVAYRDRASRRNPARAEASESRDPSILP